MSQCVPSWDIEDNHAGTLTLCSNSSGRTEPLNDAPTSDYGVAELTWENGQLAMHALGPPRQPLKSSSTWDKLRATGTLESLVDQATNNNQLLLPLSSSSYHRGKQHPPKFEAEGGLVPWINLQRPSSASATVTMDALVPCSINTRTQSKAANANNMNMMVVGCSSTRVGSCSANRGQLDHRLACVPVASHGQDLSCSHDQSLSGCSANNNNHRLMRQQQGKADLGVGFTRSGTTLDNSHNTSSDMPSPDDIDSLCHSSRPRHQREIDDDEDEEEEEEHKKKKKASGGRDTKSSGSTKRTRAAAIHNQSERKRRDKINQRMKTLQKLVPNSSKTDKASMLDEVIEYLKQLQAQVHVMGRMNMPAPAPMMLPLAMQQQLQMSMMGPMGMGMGLGMGMGMDMNPMGRPNISPAVLHPSAFMAMNPASWGDHHHASADQRLQAPNALPDPLSAFLASQSQQPMSMEAYSRMAAMYQQLQQPQPHAPNSKS